ncbi:hypothetical protein [Cohnella boryungensis]|uniref:General stress protein 17M-like domain-containing protein n=1 Tax=Cohnella boryungensis TaxID=768479 RepID=A0ABV8S9N1_9BACL
MSVTVGIFEQEDRVLEAIGLLRDAGALQEEIRVVVSSREGAPLLASRPEVNLEELYEIQETRQGRDRGAAPAALAYPFGTSTMIGGGMVGAVFEGSGEGADAERVLEEIGIPGRLSDLCANAVENGRYVVVADTASEIEARPAMENAGAVEIG